MKKTMELNFFLQLLGYFNISQLQSSKACPFENEILLVIEFYESFRRQLIMGSLQLVQLPSGLIVWNSCKKFLSYNFKEAFYGKIETFLSF